MKSLAGYGRLAVCTTLAALIPPLLFGCVAHPRPLSLSVEDLTSLASRAGREVAQKTKAMCGPSK